MINPPASYIFTTFLAALVESGACDLAAVKARADAIIAQTDIPSVLLMEIALAKDKYSLPQHETPPDLPSHCSILIGCFYWMWKQGRLDLETMRYEVFDVLDGSLAEDLPSDFHPDNWEAIKPGQVHDHPYFGQMCNMVARHHKMLLVPDMYLRFRELFEQHI